MELSIHLQPLRQSQRANIYNHKHNKVSYSLDSKTQPVNSVDFSRYSINSSQAKYLRISKSLQKIKEKEKQSQSLSSKIEERMRVRRAMELEKLFEDNTKMFARIYTQKSQYRYGKMGLLIKKRKGGNKSMKENYEVMESCEEGERVKKKQKEYFFEQPKIMKMRRVCGGHATNIIPDLKEKIISMQSLKVKRANTEAILFD